MTPDTFGPNVSVVIPCHNAGRTIRRALQSVSAQTLPVAEILVIVDDSTDNSVREIEASNITTRILQVDANNAAAARNAGIAAAHGQWVAFLDADDVWLPAHLASAGQLLDAGNDIAYCSFAEAFHDFPDRPAASFMPRFPTRNPWPIETATPGLSDGDFLDLFLLCGIFTLPTCVIRRDILASIGGFDTTQPRRHDIDLWLRVIHNRTWAYDPRPTVRFCADTPGSISRKIASSERYMLVALKKNLGRYPRGAMPTIIHNVAEAGLRRTLVHGDRGDLVRFAREACPFLSTRDLGLAVLSIAFPARLRGAYLNRRTSPQPVMSASRKHPPS